MPTAPERGCKLLVRRQTTWDNTSSPSQPKSHTLSNGASQKHAVCLFGIGSVDAIHCGQPWG